MKKTPPLSFGETAFYVTRAAVGAGAPWGAAEDLARTAQSMARAGEDPAPLLADALTRLDGGENSARAILSGAGETAEIAAKDGGALSAVYAAPVARDWLIEHAGAADARLRVLGADVPRLITAAAETLPEAVRAVWTAQTPAPGEICFMRRAAAETPDAQRGRAEGSPAHRSAGPGGGVRFDAAAWAVIETFFRRCLAPSTEASRLSGAGAGVNDTD